MDLEKFETFHLVASTGSLLEASVQLKINRSTISRRLAALEQELGHPLFEKKSGPLTLTPKGEYFLRQVTPLIISLKDIKRNLSVLDTEIGGPFIVCTTFALASVWLSKIIDKWVLANRNIELDIRCSTSPMNLFMKDADVALRPKMNDRSLVQEYVRKWRLYLYASKEYCVQNGTPKTVDELKHHRLIAFGDAPNVYSTEHVNWHTKNSKGEFGPPFIRINSLEGMFNLVESGLGIGTFTKELNGVEKLVPILHNEIFFDAELYFIYHKNNSQSNKLLSFRQFIFNHID